MQETNSALGAYLSGAPFRFRENRQSGLQLLSKDKRSSLLALRVSNEEDSKNSSDKHSSLLAFGVSDEEDKKISGTNTLAYLHSMSVMKKIYIFDQGQTL